MRCAPIAALAVTLLLLATAAGAAQAAPPAYDIRGTWEGVAGSGVSGTVVWETEDCATGAISGRGSTAGDTWKASGTIDGASVTLAFGSYASDPNYSATGTGTFTDADHISGTFHDTEGYKDKAGSFQIARTSGPPRDGKGCGSGKRGSATKVGCNYNVATDTDTCTAAVGDVGAPPAVTPTGTVTFTSTSGGVFIAGSTCSLAPTPSSPGVASCSVRYRPPSSDFPKITAAYAGDERHAASSAQSEFLILAITEQDGGPLDPTTCTEEAEASARRAPVTAAKKNCDWKETAKRNRDFSCYTAWLATGAAAAAAASKNWLGAIVFGLVAAYEHSQCAKWKKIAKDPPDRDYKAIALPRPAALGAGTVPSTCPGKPRADCRELLAVVRRFASAQGRVRSLLDTLGAVQDRLLTAMRARDTSAMAMQVAARKAHSGQLADAQDAAQRAAAALARVWPRLADRATTIDPTRPITEQELRRAVSVLPAAARRAIPIPTPSWLTELVNAVAGTRKAIDVPALLRRQAPDLTTIRRDFRSMRLENLRALVRGLARLKLTIPAKADRLLADLACSRGHPRPSVAAFRARLRTSMPRRYADFVRFAAKPLVGRKLTCGS